MHVNANLKPSAWGLSEKSHLTSHLNRPDSPSHLQLHTMTMPFDTPDFNLLKSKAFTYRLFGAHCENSKAPLLHNFLFENNGLESHRYEIFASEDVEGFVKLISGNQVAKSENELVFNGCAVTLPHKVTMVDHVDIVDENARAVGAINTIYVRFDASGKALNIGTNTDTIGIRDAFLLQSANLVEESRRTGRPGLVYGGGGASRAAVYALHQYLGCSKVYVVNRFKEEITALAETMRENGFTGEIIAVSSAAEAQALDQPLLAVLCVPDVEPLTPEEKTAKEVLEVFRTRGPGCVIEMCYYPHVETRLHKEFASAGWQVINGVEPMIYQAIAQQTLWTGVELEDMPLREAIEHLYENLFPKSGN